ncbi:hypothetical protein NADFUDRAFT_49885 [Nadsonia fulvescens var. elongata DSM 6958]|uniref:Proteasome assembly chaperone 2 n=1 Tax=Nadsonia fulvescens var. elongata DSM 6958 TaxID=857566 RepID=A0A1E3PPU2_9ASCO|nr:hypothetical protein NADFUDRAFT_49885 [Nadsonia fulvescens var. elongata DSM 6958]
MSTKIFYPLSESRIDYSLYTLILPTVSVGNVPQLATDLLIHTLGATLVGRLDDEHVFPFAGPRDTSSSVKPGTENHVTTPLEVFSAGNLLILQVRSPPLPGHARDFQDMLFTLVKELEVKDVLVLGSSDKGLTESGNSAIEVVTFESKGDKSEGKSAMLLMSKIRDLTIDHNSTNANDKDDDNVWNIIYKESTTPYGWLLYKLAGLLETETLVPAIVITSYVYEGDNFGDGEEMAAKVFEVLNLERKSDWVRPMSWVGAYGREIKIGLEEGLYS